MISRLTARSVAPAIAGLVLVVSILAGGATPAAAVAPTIVGPSTVSIGAFAQKPMGGIRDALAVRDSDTAVLEVGLSVPGTLVVRPTFTLDGTSGLTVASGSATASRSVVVRGSATDLNAALDGLVLDGGAAEGSFTLEAYVDDTPGTTAGRVAKVVALTVTTLAPQITAGGDTTVGTHARVVLTGAAAPRVDDPDSPALDISVRIVPSLPATLETGPVFSLDGNIGLTVIGGELFNSQIVRVSGTLAALNAALDGMRLDGGTEAGLYALEITATDRIGGPGGQTRTTSVWLEQTDIAPDLAVPASLTVGTSSDVQPFRFLAPSVTDADSPEIGLTLRVVDAIPSAPTFSVDADDDIAIGGSRTRSAFVSATGSPTALTEMLRTITIHGGTGPGPSTLRLTATDHDPGGNTDVANVAITVTDVAPTVDAPSTLAIDAGGARVAPIDLADPDSAAVEVRLRMLGTDAGRPRFNLLAPGLTFTAGDRIGDVALDFHGQVGAVADAVESRLLLQAGASKGTFTAEVTVDDAVGATVGNVATATITVRVETPPGAPRNVAATVRAAQATVTWQAPSANGSPALTGYRLRVLRGGIVQTIELGPSVRSHVVTGLPNATAHSFQVQAVAGPFAGPQGTSATVTPQAFWPFASAGAMADRMYLDLLGRAPTAGERSAAVAPLANGTGSAAALVAQLRGSSDNLQNVDPVTRLYQAYFLRIPDQGGLDFWIARRRSGQGLNPISEGFARSPEFTTRYGSLSNEGFVELVYANVLGRPGAPSEVAFWTDQLDTGVRTRGRVMTGFSESPEYKGQQRNAVDVSVAFIALLGRRPTTPEHTFLVTALTNGSLTLAGLHTSILEGTEYADLVT